MLKWTIAKREQALVGAKPARTATSSCTTQRRSIDALRERKQRRHSARRASLCVRLDKENRGITTPTTRTDCDVKALRDVSNLTPTPRSFCDDSSPTRIVPRARKKQCLDPGHLKQHQLPEGLLNIPLQNNNCPSISQTVYSSTLPSLQMEYSPCLREATCPGGSVTKYPYQLLPHLKPSNLNHLNNLNNINYLNPTENNTKRLKIDHVDDFLHQISYITSPEELQIKPTAKQKRISSAKQVSVTPLLKKIVDLRFSQISTSINVDKDDSTGFNDLSLDKIVDAILDTTESEERISAIDTETQIINENQNVEIQLNTCTSMNISIVDAKEITKRKRTKSITEDDSFKLKRQKCVRRRKQQNTLNNNDVPYEDNVSSTPTSTINEVEFSFRENLNDNSFNSSCISGKNYSTSKINIEQSSGLSQQLECLRYSPWRREICCGLGTPSLEKFAKEVIFKRKRKMCRSVSDKSMTMTASSTPTKIFNGFIDIQTDNTKGILHVNGEILFKSFFL